MKTFKQFLEVWTGGYRGIGLGSENNHEHVKVNKPGDENHGKVGRVVRQQSLDYGIEMAHTPNKLHWYNANHLQKQS